MEKKRYGAIDGLRTIASIGIVLMHIKANTDYGLTGFVAERFIMSSTNFVFLFMTISAFGMCCGYYEKVRSGQVDWNKFYGKRFGKVLPFFAALVLLDIVMNPSINSLIEGFADVTLVFGLLNKSIGVIGVGWFLGLVFIFYLIFPFYTTFLSSKGRAWLVFGVSILYNLVCEGYFGLGRSNILYSSCFFMAGGLLYLYRDEIKHLNKWLVLSLIIGAEIFYYALYDGALMCLLLSVLFLIFAMISQGGYWKTVSRTLSAVSA